MILRLFMKMMVIAVLSEEILTILKFIYFLYNFALESMNFRVYIFMLCLISTSLAIFKSSDRLIRNVWFEGDNLLI